MLEMSVKTESVKGTLDIISTITLERDESGILFVKHLPHVVSDEITLMHENYLKDRIHFSYETVKSELIMCESKVLKGIMKVFDTEIRTLRTKGPYVFSIRTCEMWGILKSSKENRRFINKNILDFIRYCNDMGIEIVKASQKYTSDAIPNSVTLDNQDNVNGKYYRYDTPRYFYLKKLKEDEELRLKMETANRIYDSLSVVNNQASVIDDEKVGFYCNCIGDLDAIMQISEDVLHLHLNNTERRPWEDTVICNKCGTRHRILAKTGSCICGAKYSYYYWNDVTGCAKCHRSFVD